MTSSGIGYGRNSDLPALFDLGSFLLRGEKTNSAEVDAIRAILVQFGIYNKVFRDLTPAGASILHPNGVRRDLEPALKAACPSSFNLKTDTGRRLRRRLSYGFGKLHGRDDPLNPLRVDLFLRLMREYERMPVKRYSASDLMERASVYPAVLKVTINGRWERDQLNAAFDGVERAMNGILTAPCLCSVSRSDRRIAALSVINCLSINTSDKWNPDLLTLAFDRFERLVTLSFSEQDGIQHWDDDSAIAKRFARQKQ